MKKIIICLLLFLSNSVFSDNTQSDLLFNWAEVQYPHFFSPAIQPSQTADIWYFRHYPTTNNYLGVNTSDEVYVLGDVFGGLKLVGTLQTMLAEVDPVELQATVITTNTQGRKEITLTTGNIFVSIPASTFTMGNNKYSVLEASPEHLVTISKNFWISKNLITNTEFNTFITETGYKSDLQKSESIGCYVYNTEEEYFIATTGRYYANAFTNTISLGNHPVVCISYNDALAYATWLANKTGLKVNVATEAQWELAAKGTTQKKYPWGDSDPDSSRANIADLQFSIYYADSQQGNPDTTIDDGYAATSPVGSYPAGASQFGVMDMAGNAAEWVLDFFSDYSSASVTDPIGPSSGEQRVNRGGNWVDNYSATPEQHTIITVARTGDDATSGDDHMGFRVVINQ